MKEKLKILMQHENIRASQLAERLEIKPAAISHILSGRNNPSYDLIRKLVLCFPHINPGWLVGDESQMMREDHQVTDPASALHSPLSEVSQQSLDFTEGEKSNIDDFTQKSPVSTRNSDILRVVLFYADGSCETFTPRR